MKPKSHNYSLFLSIFHLTDLLTFLSYYLSKGKILKKAKSEWGKIAASVLLKLFMNGNER